MAEPNARYDEPGPGLEGLRHVATGLRRHVIRMTSEAGSGHPTTCLSAADLVATLFFHALRYEVPRPANPHNDRVILSKGHAAPLLYAAWAEAGAFPAERLLTLRRIDSELEGHPTPRLPWVDVATGSLGQGLAVGVGMAQRFPVPPEGSHMRKTFLVLVGVGVLAWLPGCRSSAMRKVDPAALHDSSASCPPGRKWPT